jgi:hypothetical protein
MYSVNSEASSVRTGKRVELQLGERQRMGSRTERPAADVRQRARTGAGEKGKGPTHRSGIGPSNCPSWARTRTLLIQRGQRKHLNSSNLQAFTRVRVTRCWSLMGFMLDFAVLYSLKCRGLSWEA